MGNYVHEISQATGLPPYEKKGPFTKMGAAIGVRNGYLSAIGPNQIDSKSAVSIMIRFRHTLDHTPIADALANSTQFLDAIGEKKWKKSIAESLVFGADYLLFNWKYTLSRPSPEKIAAAHTAIIEAIRSVAPPAESRCDICQKSSVTAPSLYNGVPGYYCGSCQSQAHGQQNAASAEYETRETNLARGLLFGLIAAVLGSLAWGGVAYAINYIFFYGALLIGAMIAKAVFYGIGKINLVGQVMVFVLTVTSVFFGDAIFFTLSVMKSESLPFSADLLFTVVEHMVEIEMSEAQGFFTLLFAVVGAAAVVYSNRKPKFVAEFEPLEGSNASHESKELTGVAR